MHTAVSSRFLDSKVLFLGSAEQLNVVSEGSSSTGRLRMKSAWQHGTAQADIAKFSQIVNENQEKLDRATNEASSSLQHGRTVADDVRRLNSATASLKKSEKQGITRNWELRSVGRRGSARDAISFFNHKDSTKAVARNSISKPEEKNAQSESMSSSQKSAGGTDTNVADSNNFDKYATGRNWDLRVVGRKGSARDAIRMFNNMANENKQKLDKNPFSETYSIPKYDTAAQDYGRPTRGSKTEARGIKAGDYVMREVLFLCEVINTHAEGDPPNRIIKFGPLFYIYAHYSDKLVGMLIRARKYKLVDFEGEMLYQRQDDDKIIRLLKPIEEIRKIERSGDPVNCMAMATDRE